MRTLRETYLDLIYIVSRKRQDLLSKLGAWGPWQRIEREGRGRKGAEKMSSSIKINLKKEWYFTDKYYMNSRNHRF